MALLVQKYGATSVGSVERIQTVAKRVANLLEVRTVSRSRATRQGIFATPSGVPKMMYGSCTESRIKIKMITRTNICEGWVTTKSNRFRGLKEDHCETNCKSKGILKLETRECNQTPRANQRHIRAHLLSQ